MGRHSTDIIGKYKLQNGDGMTVGSFSSSEYRKELKQYLEVGVIKKSEYEENMALVTQLVHMTHYLVIKLEGMDTKSGIDT